MMNKLKLVIICFITIIGVSCSVPVFAEEESTAEPVFQLDRTSYSIYKGKTEALHLTKENIEDDVTWKSSNKKVAPVSSAGKVTAKKKGTAVITVSAGSYQQTCKIKVTTNRWTYLLDKYRYSSSVKQLIFVKYKGKSKAEVVLYTKSNHKWKKKLSCTGYVGKKGINKKKEGDKKTPTGTYNLTGSFGIKSNPGSKMKYTKINKYLYLCEDKKYYNQLIDIRKHPHTCKGEHMINYRPNYDYGMFIDYNKSCTYNKGSAIFLHCKGKYKYTSGCIAVSKTNMKKIMKTVNYGSKICIYKK